MYLYITAVSIEHSIFLEPGSSYDYSQEGLAGLAEAALAAGIATHNGLENFKGVWERAKAGVEYLPG